MKQLKTFLTAGLLAGALLAPAAAVSVAPVATPTVQAADKNEIDPVTGKPIQNSSVVDYISDAYFWLALIGGLLAVMMLIYAGYRYMGSGGDPEQVADAKDIIEKALIGLGLLIMAAVILRTINPRTVNPCTPNQPNCGSIDFTKPNGGKQQGK